MYRDRDPDREADADLSHRGRDSARALVPVDPGGPPRPRHARRDAVAVERIAAAYRDTVGSPLRDADYRPVRVVAAEVGGIGFEQLADFARHRGEHRVWPRLASDERGNTPQRGLLVSELAECGARLGVRERGRHEIREVREPRPRVFGKRWAF